MNKPWSRLSIAFLAITFLYLVWLFPQTSIEASSQGDGTHAAHKTKVHPSAATPTTFSNPGNILIPAGAPGATSGIASPYPASVVVSGLTGTTSKVTITLKNENHTFPDDIDILLVSPTGQSVILMSDTGGSLDILNVSLTFDDAAATSLSDSGQLVSGTFKPTNIGAGDSFPAPAPAGTPGTTLSVFNGQNPNGTWSLYVVDDLGGDSGNIANGFDLNITTNAVVVNSVLSINDVSQPEGTSPDTFTVTLTPASATPVTVSYATANGTATAGSDYTATSGTLTFAPGVTTQPISVPIINDNLTEPDETFFVNLSNAVGATIGDPQGVGTITNDDFLDHLTVYATDVNNNRIQKSTNSGQSWTVIGGPGTALGSFNAPRGVSSSINDMRLFVADTNNNRIQRSTNGGQNWQLIAGPGTAVGTVNGPQGVAYDEKNDILYIADTLNNRIQMVVAASTNSFIVSIYAGAAPGTGVGQFNQPHSVATDNSGLVYVADTNNNRIQQNSNGSPTGWSVFASAGTATGFVNSPRGVYVNGLGEVYIADTNNNRIQKNFNGNWSVFMSAGTAVGSVRAPEGVVSTSNGNVFIGDTLNNRIQSKPMTGGTAVVVGAPGLSVGQFNQPSGMR